MSDWATLRPRVRTLEQQTDQLLHQFSIDSKAPENVESQIADVLSESIIDQMQTILDGDPNPGTKIHHLDRHRQILQDHSKEFKRIQGTISEARDREQLLSSLRESASTRSRQEEYTLTEERNRIDESNSLTDSLLARAYATRDSFVTQRATLLRVQNTIGQAARKVPGLNVLLKKIDTRKKRDTLIIATLISFCLLASLQTYELRKQNKAELEQKLDELRQELASLRVQKIAGGSASKLTRISSVRKDIARVLTVISQSQRAHLREYYAGKKYQPLDLRPKKTRALRRKLTKFEATRKTAKQSKKNIHFGKKLYYLKA